jgi:hypothetical protein
MWPNAWGRDGRIAYDSLEASGLGIRFVFPSGPDRGWLLRSEICGGSKRYSMPLDIAGRFDGAGPDATRSDTSGSSASTGQSTSAK